MGPSSLVVYQSRPVGSRFLRRWGGEGRGFQLCGGGKKVVVVVVPPPTPHPLNKNQKVQSSVFEVPLPRALLAAALTGGSLL